MLIEVNDDDIAAKTGFAGCKECHGQGVVDDTADDGWIEWLDCSTCTETKEFIANFLDLLLEASR